MVRQVDYPQDSHNRDALSNASAAFDSVVRSHAVGLPAQQSLFVIEIEL